MPIMERLGEFYLGQRVNPQSGEVESNPYLYTSSDLLTHAMIVGMTGSGKTGLGIDLLEEAALDRIPALVIDPKGDMSNLLLNDPEFSAKRLASWLPPQMAEQVGMDDFAFAEREAQQKKAALAAEGMEASRVALLAQAEKILYTPGSHAGVSLSIFNLMECPSQAILEDADAFAEYLSTTVTSLLSLVGESTDSLTSPAFLFLSSLLAERWQRGESLTIPTLIGAIQQPAMEKIGVLPLESFYPSKDRFALAMRFNALLASPKFSAWLDGEPLHIEDMLYTPDGNPRMAIVSIQHLSDSERMFFVTLLLNQLVSWMRRQPGQPSLRALCYMDEIQGFFPPVANPPSKAPMMTLLKQARAFGLGLVLATQNPADLDYKGLSNIGTWFIGHLQTAQDRERLLEGMEEGDALDAQIATLPKRTFLVHNIHESAPDLFKTRQTLSYLVGPLMPSQLKQLRQREDLLPSSQEAASVAPTISSNMEEGSALSTTPPLLPESVPTYFLLSETATVYVPTIGGMAHVLYEDAKINLMEERDWCYLTEVPINPMPADWEKAERRESQEISLTTKPPVGVQYLEGDLSSLTKKHFTEWEKTLKDFIYAQERLEIPYHAATKTYGKPEDPQGFRIALENALRVQRDAEMQKIKVKYEKKIQTLEERIRKANQTVEREESQAKHAKKDMLVSLGAAVLGGLLGKKAISVSNLGRVSRTARSLSRQKAQDEDVSRAQDNVEAVKQQLSAVQAEMEAELGKLSTSIEQGFHEVEKRAIPPKKMNIQVQDLMLVWVPEEMRRK